MADETGTAETEVQPGLLDKINARLSTLEGDIARLGSLIQDFSANFEAKYQAEIKAAVEPVSAVVADIQKDIASIRASEAILEDRPSEYFASDAELIEWMDKVLHKYFFGDKPLPTPEPVRLEIVA